MTIRQSAKLRMYLAVSALCGRAEFAGIITLIPAFASALKSFLAMPDRIQEARKAQKTPTKGITGSKSETRTELTKVGQRIGASLTTFADATGDIELRGAAEEAAVPLERGGEMEAAARAETLEALATKHRAILVAEYGLKDADLDTFATSLTAFSQMLGRPRSTIALKRSATESIPDLFVEADAYLDRMDRLSLNLEPEHPEFVGAYKASRLIGALPYRRKKNPAGVATETIPDAAPAPARPQTPTTPAPAHATSDGLTS